MLPTTLEHRFNFESHTSNLYVKTIARNGSGWVLCLTKMNDLCAQSIDIRLYPGHSAWKAAVLTIRQHGTILLQELFTPDNCERTVTLAPAVDPNQSFQATITETPDDDLTSHSAASLPLPVCSASDVDDVLGCGASQEDGDGLHEIVERNFDQPSELYSTVLVIGEKKVYVNKDFLAIHSLFFEKLFFGEFAERGKSEVVLKDNIDHDKFIEFLRVIHPDGKKVTWKNVEDVLPVANYVQSASALKKCSRFLLKDELLSMLDKLHVADKHELTGVIDTLLNRMTLPELQSVAKEGKHLFSSLLKTRIYDKHFQ